MRSRSVACLIKMGVYMIVKKIDTKIINYLNKNVKFKPFCNVSKFKNIVIRDNYIIFDNCVFYKRCGITNLYNEDNLLCVEQTIF